ncbi:MAG: rhomboid family intramembrane serine protease [Dokdonella sp.]|uniref:rhomboid family intramembrane serine protease n=1 Tax=Dokdonella sp. TaxID=2291710 RepID=UPI003F814BB9
MLIVPLHRAPTRASFPWVTLALILVNAFVFFGLQLPDEARQEQALEFYVQDGLARWEFPAYRDWLAQHAEDGRNRLFERMASDEGDRRWAAALLQSDDAFVAALHDGTAIDPSVEGIVAWRESRAEFERLWDRAFTERWKLRQSEIAPARIVGSMFLHGSVGHLLGNMLFLALLGLLVEGALGPVLFLVGYLLGGIGAAFASLAWHWGDHGSLVGASGAIASLMGAYCVLWGARKVRFFWWFFVVFDYVRAPALVLLPAWLGWEVLQLAFVHDSNVAFEAHAGGIVCGAALAVAVRRLGWERREFLDEEARADAANEDEAALAQAQAHLGRLDIAAARALLEPLAARRPADLAVRIALYRCARYEPGMPRIDEAARAVLALPLRTAAQLSEQKGIYDDYLKAGAGRRLPLTPVQQLGLARRWPAIGAGAAAAELLGGLAARAPATPGLAAAMLQVACDLDARREEGAARALLARIAATWPGTAEADKANRLLAPQA